MRRPRQSGASTVEFLYAAPIVSCLCLLAIQYGLLFFAKSQINHASFMAARAGSVANARMSDITGAYARALVPLYGGASDERGMLQAQARAAQDIAVNARIEILNPTKESFDDFAHDAALNAKYGARAIPNAALALRPDIDAVKGSSGQSLQDANLLKLRITHGYEPRMPLVGPLFLWFMRSAGGKNAFQNSLIQQGRIPVVADVTLAMQTEAVEDPRHTQSFPGPGNEGQPRPPSDPVEGGGGESTGECGGVDCTQPGSPDDGTADPQNVDHGGMCRFTLAKTFAADPAFEFGRATLTAAGRRALDEFIVLGKGREYRAIQVTGHTDPLGSDSANAALSLARAAAVRNYLVAHGMGSRPIAVRGLGSAEPIVQLADCPYVGQDQIDCLAPNRRFTVKLED
jgi:outer membrane protein OmpA-like peptidoglycan-associated protein